MVRITENANCKRVRLFHWNQKQYSDPLPENYGLFVFHVDDIIDIITTSLPPPPGHDNRPNYKLSKSSQNIVLHFDRNRLLSTESIQVIGPCAVLGTKLFQPETVHSLGEEISDYLLKNFHFSAESESVIGPAKSKPVIFVNVNRNKLVEYGALDEIDYFWDTEELEFDPESSYTRDHWLVLATISRFVGISPGLVLVEPETAFEKIMIDDEGGGEMVVGDCPICLQGLLGVEMEVVKTPCSHLFHRSCLLEWLPKCRSCPICWFEFP